MEKQIRIVSAPSILGLKPGGVEKLPEALIESGLLDKLNSVYQIIEIPTLNNNYNNTRDPLTKCLNPASIHEFSIRLKKTIENQKFTSAFPIVLGGDCSILIGILAGLKSMGDYGLIFIDAHADFYQPEKSITGEVADMALAIVTGRGPEILTNIDNLKPYVLDKNVIHIGQRDAEEAQSYGSHDIASTEIKLIDYNQIKTADMEGTVGGIIKHLKKLNPGKFWIHFDTDVISDEENPAVDYRIPGGISFTQTKYILKRLIQTDMIQGMDVTIYNPYLDPGGEIAMRITDCLAHAIHND